MVHPRKLAGKHRTERLNRRLGVFLAFVAGAVNTAGYLVAHRFTSHLTGIASLTADALALGQWHQALLFFFFLFCFVMGAATTAILVLWARGHRLHAQYALPLLLEALLLVIFCSQPPAGMDAANKVVAVLCFLMGLQNAVITKLSNFSIRTTHITGMSTDIGISLGRLIGNAFGFKNHPNDVIHYRLAIHVKIVASFILGGTFGAYGFGVVGLAVLLPFAGALLLVALLPLWQDVKTRRRLKRFYYSNVRR